MFEEMTFVNGNFEASFPLSSLRYTSALMASSPRTAYCTFRISGFKESAVRGRIVVAVCEERETVERTAEEVDDIDEMVVAARPRKRLGFALLQPLSTRDCNMLMACVVQMPTPSSSYALEICRPCRRAFAER